MKTTMIFAFSLAFAAAGSVASAQQVISAKSGMVNYVEGAVFLDTKPVESKFGVFPGVNNGSQLRTEEGRAEVLLGPGVFLRMGENSSFKMISNRLSDARLEVLSGSMVVECAELPKDESIAVSYQGSTATLVKNGVYRFDAAPPQLMVYDGEAKVERSGQTQTVKKARLLALAGDTTAQKFDNKEGDPLFRWAARRSQYLAVANMASARSVSQYGNWGSSGWIFNPYFGTFTYLPVDGYYSNFWGYRYFSPSLAYAGYGYGYGYVPGGRSYVGKTAPVTRNPSRPSTPVTAGSGRGPSSPGRVASGNGRYSPSPVQSSSRPSMVGSGPAAGPRSR